MSTKTYRLSLGTILIALSGAALASCGQMGPLVQRSSGQTTTEPVSAEVGEDEESDEDER